MAKIVIDNGSGYAKAGLSSSSEPQRIPNAMMRPKGSRKGYIGAQIADCKDPAGLFYKRPFEKGYVTNLDLMRDVWGHITKDVLKTDPTESSVVVTEPPFNFDSIRDGMDEIMFEDLQVKELYRTSAAELCGVHRASDDRNPCTLVIDSGFSFSHVTPCFLTKPQLSGIRRVDVGGKAMTNWLKERISYQQLDVSEETYVIDRMKHDVCYVATDFKEELSKSSRKLEDNPIALNYVLPDFSTVHTGTIQSREDMLANAKKRKRDASDNQILRVNNERFSIPEMLFTPSLVGLDQMGISEAPVHAVKEMHPDMHAPLYANVLLVGGNVNLKGYKERFETELRKHMPNEFTLNIHVPERPDEYAWRGGSILIQKDNFPSLAVTKTEYEEHGRNICRKKFSPTSTEKTSKGKSS